MFSITQLVDSFSARSTIVCTGVQMLEKMGWQKGEGLGNGNGRVDPVLAAQYTKGVGLGASTGSHLLFSSGFSPSQVINLVTASSVLMFLSG